MITYKEYKAALKIVEDYKIQLDETIKQVNKETNGINKFVAIDKDSDLFKVASVRLYNILRANFKLETVDGCWSIKLSELSKVSISKLKECRHCGTKTIDELLEICRHANIQLQD